jgi:glycosyltransferase involved in cell wall biosynthesis
LTLITVVIPAFNDADMLEQCLACLAVQLRPADEVIVVDNGSTDRTAAVALAAGARVVSQPVRGIWPAASLGYDEARGDIIARLDADSRPPMDWLMHIEAEFIDSPEIGFLTGPGDFYDGNALIVFLGQNVYIAGFFWSMTIWLGHSPVFGSNFAMRREAWQSVRGRVHRDERAIHDDLDLSLHLTPDLIVRLDESLRVGISSRPFASWSGIGRRLGWVYLTFKLHWPEDSPWRRRADRRHWKKLNDAQNDEQGLPGAIA